MLKTLKKPNRYKLELKIPRHPPFEYHYIGEDDDDAYFAEDLTLQLGMFLYNHNLIKARLVDTAIYKISKGEWIKLKTFPLTKVLRENE